MEIYFFNFTNYPIEKDFFEKIIKTIFEKKLLSKDLLKKIEKLNLGVVLVGQRRIKALNKRYLGKNRVTDVLSFPQIEIKKPTKKDLQFFEGEEEKILGEILLCPSRIRKQARRFKESFEKEIAHVFIHGFLHLLGFDHKDTKSTKEMRKKEKEILNSLDKLKPIKVD